MSAMVAVVRILFTPPTPSRDTMSLEFFAESSREEPCVLLAGSSREKCAILSLGTKFLIFWSESLSIASSLTRVRNLARELAMESGTDGRTEIRSCVSAMCQVQPYYLFGSKFSHLTIFATTAEAELLAIKLAFRLAPEA